MNTNSKNSLVLNNNKETKKRKRHSNDSANGRNKRKRNSFSSDSDSSSESSSNSSFDSESQSKSRSNWKRKLSGKANGNGSVTFKVKRSDAIKPKVLATDPINTINIRAMVHKLSEFSAQFDQKMNKLELLLKEGFKATADCSLQIEKLRADMNLPELEQELGNLPSSSLLKSDHHGKKDRGYRDDYGPVHPDASDYSDSDSSDGIRYPNEHASSYSDDDQSDDDVNSYSDDDGGGNRRRFYDTKRHKKPRFDNYAFQNYRR